MRDIKVTGQGKLTIIPDRTILSISLKGLERMPEEERMFLQKTFQYMINALPDADEEL